MRVSGEKYEMVRRLGTECFTEWTFVAGNENEEAACAEETQRKAH